MRWTAFLIVLAGLALGAGLQAQEERAAPPAAEPAQESEEDNSVAAKIEVETEGGEEQRRRRTLERFVPTEKISADSPVSFPVDI